MNLIEQSIQQTAAMAEQNRQFLPPRSVRAEAEGAQLELETLLWIRDEIKAGTPLVSAFFRPTLTRAMGMIPVSYPWLVMNAVEKAAEYRKSVGRLGMPEYSCDHLILPNTAILCGDAPKPALVISTYGECPAITHGFKFMAAKMGVPEFSIDVPVDYKEENIRYLAEQIEKLVQFAESEVPGVKYDRDRHRKLLQQDGEYYRESARQWLTRSTRPFHLNYFDSAMGVPMGAARLPSLMYNSAGALEYVKHKTRDIEELAATVPADFSDRQKLRIFIVLAAPVYVNPVRIMNLLNEYNAVVVGNYAGVNSFMCGARAPIGDEQEFGRKLSPFEEEARMMLGFGWRQRGQVWVDEILSNVVFTKANAVLVEQWTDCACTNSLAKVVADAVEKECGVPVGVISHKMQDPSSMSEEEYLARFREFLDIAASSQE
ncbi:MAG: 2-hydroxyacyl-CoA dehydratase family protein [Clostridiales bacterium]|nr:2-hydroxyacyl-CoA dehydratase family protein [Clostridiales bacterium]